MSQCLVSPRLGWDSSDQQAGRGEHVLVPGIGWLLKGWWGETEQGAQDYNGACAPQPRYGSKDVIQPSFQFTKVFITTDLHTYSQACSLTLRNTFYRFLTPYIVLVRKIVFRFPVRFVYPIPKGIGFLFWWCSDIDYKWFPVDKSF